MNLTVVPEYLATTGIYRLTRNPMYFGGALMQAGWAILMGSVPVGLFAMAYLVGLDRVGIPFKERLLTSRHGESYQEYRRRVPKWLPTGERKEIVRISATCRFAPERSADGNADPPTGRHGHLGH